MTQSDYDNLVDELESVKAQLWCVVQQRDELLAAGSDVVMHWHTLGVSRHHNDNCPYCRIRDVIRKVEGE